MAAIDAAPAPRTRRILIVVAMTLTSFLPTINITIANVILPQMQGDLSASLEEISWVLTATMIATAIAIPASGWISIRFGSKRSIKFFIICFTVVTAMFGFATSLEEVVLWRTLQGLFGGPLNPMAIPVLLNSFERKDHSFVMATWAGGSTLSTILGPPLGGLLTDLFNWRLAFMFLVPIGIAAYALVLAVIDDTPSNREARFDWPGFASLSLALASFQLMMDRGNRLDWFESGEIIGWAALGSFALYAFLFRSLTTHQPFIDLRIFLDRNFTIGCVYMMVLGVLTFAPLMLLPNFLSQLRGAPIETVSWMITPRGIGFVAGTLILGRVMKHLDSRVVLAAGLGVQCVALVYMAGFDMYVGFADVALAGLILGAGEAIMWIPLAAISFSTLATGLRTYGAALFQFSRFFASGIGISIIVTVLSRSTRTSQAELLENVTAAGLPGLTSLQESLWNVGTLPGLARLDAEVFRQAATIGYTNDFLLLLALTLAVIPLLFLLERPPRTD
jgi:DHA2 family multidrug resistance protein